MCINKPIVARHGSPAGVLGFSLVEVIVFIMIVSVALVGVLSVMNLTTQRSADPLIRKQAIAVAESMLEEFSLQAYAGGGFAGPYIQDNRQFFDDISDYNGFTTSGIFPIDGTTAIPGLTAYTLDVTIVGSALNAIPAADARLITVTVTGPDGVPVAMSGYRTNY